jgi:hypothetical protein
MTLSDRRRPATVALARVTTASENAFEGGGLATSAKLSLILESFAAFIHHSSPCRD